MPHLSRLSGRLPESTDSSHLKEQSFGETRLYEKRIGACRARPPLVGRLREPGHDDHDCVVKIRLLPYHIDERHAIHATLRKGKVGHDDVRSKTAEDAEGGSGPRRASDLKILVLQEVHVHLAAVDKAIDDEDAPAAIEGDPRSHTYPYQVQDPSACSRSLLCDFEMTAPVL